MKAVVLDPSNGFNTDRTLLKGDVQKLVKVIIQQFSKFELLLAILNVVFVLVNIAFSSVKENPTKSWCRQMRVLFFLIKRSLEVHRLFFLTSWVTIMHVFSPQGHKIALPPLGRHKVRGQRSKCVCSWVCHFLFGK